MPKSNVLAEKGRLNQLESSTHHSAGGNSSVVSRVLKSDMSLLEPLIRSQNLTEEIIDGSRNNWYETGPWDQGHWANRQ